jgi:polyisoprenoid-binding protein YceI
MLMTGASFASGTYTIDSVHSSVAFKVRHLVSRTAGEFNDFSGTITADFENLAGSGVELRIQAASIDTKDEGRDKHLRSADFFDVEKYPEITFSSSKVTKVDDTSFAVVGTLNMHGVSRQITLTTVSASRSRSPSPIWVKRPTRGAVLAQGTSYRPLSTVRITASPGTKRWTTVA